MKRGAKNFLTFVICFLIFITLIGVIYFNWIFSYNCKSLECFKAHQEKCSRAIYILDSEISTMEYFVVGKSDGLCEIKIKNLQVKEGSIENKNLEGKSMNCFIEIGNTNNPETNLKDCHGDFKEQLQELIIKNMHTQIVKNLETSSVNLTNQSG